MNKTKKTFFLALFIFNLTKDTLAAYISKKIFLPYIKKFKLNIKKEFTPKNLIFNFGGSTAFEYGAFKYNQFKNNNNKDFSFNNLKEIFSNAAFGTFIGATAVGPILKIFSKSKKFNIFQKKVKDMIANNIEQNPIVNIVENTIPKETQKELSKNAPKIVYTNLFNKVKNNPIGKKLLEHQKIQKQIQNRLYNPNKLYSDISMDFIKRNFKIKNILATYLTRKAISAETSNEVSGYFDPIITKTLYIKENKQLDSLKLEKNKIKKNISNLINYFDEKIPKTKKYKIKNNELVKKELKQKYDQLKIEYEKHNRLLTQISKIDKEEPNSKKYLNIKETIQEMTQEKDLFDFHIESIKETLQNIKIL
jgi:hypothetical protein